MITVATPRAAPKGTLVCIAVGGGPGEIKVTFNGTPLASTVEIQGRLVKVTVRAPSTTGVIVVTAKSATAPTVSGATFVN